MSQQEVFPKSYCLGLKQTSQVEDKRRGYRPKKNYLQQMNCI